ncbi:GRF-type domain-containing protein [Heracleum sosnowskyi]|uniref:GRF-type domain-containing protein n=1 Tax=Heracleum sosnowskyi TaxID=360622 RepID=A0AAD8IFJ7_9APIA|nr:GRF-type domain-containing protein [Heracleum sosnowskyi]
MTAKCYCGAWSVQQTAWTSANTGHRFLACPFRKCRFFNWIDPPLCDRARTIIPSLIRRMNRLEAKLKNAQQTQTITSTVLDESTIVGENTAMDESILVDEIKKKGVVAKP